MQTDGHVRIPPVELPDDSREKACTHHRRQTDADMAALQIAQTVQLRREADEGFYNILRFCQQDFARIGQSYTFAFTVKKVCTQLFLQIADHFADRRLSNKQGFCRSGEAVQPCRLDKIL
ncbi:hypothetical protein D3C86_1887780 [compost metagenome]